MCSPSVLMIPMPIRSSGETVCYSRVHCEASFFPPSSERRASSQLVMKVTRKRARASGEVLETKMEPFGLIESSFEFEGLADFQVEAPAQVRPLGLQERVETYLDDVLGKPEVIPARFAASDAPGQLTLLNVKAKEAAPKPRRFRAQCKWATKEPPLSRYGGSATLKAPEQALRNRVELLFAQERPVWTENALLLALWKQQPDTKPDVRKLNLVLPHVAFRYEFRNGGPFKLGWIRYGYDVRSDPNARFYQPLEFRVPASKPSKFRSRETMLKRSKSASNVPSVLQTVRTADEDEDDDNEDDDDDDDDTPSVFDSLPRMEAALAFALPVTSHRVVLQMCDISLPSVRKMVFVDSKPPTTIDETTGWYTAATMASIKEQLKKEYARLCQQEYANKFEPCPSFDQLIKMVQERRIGAYFSLE